MLSRISGDPSQRSPKNSATLTGIYLEDNIEATPGTNIIPGLRFDYHNDFGSNWSPSLNLSQDLGDMFKVKAGIAWYLKRRTCISRARGIFSTRGNGCPISIADGNCYLLGNPDLDPESASIRRLALSLT